MATTLKSAIAQVVGVRIDAVEEATSPRGNVLYGVRCPPDECWEVWRELRDAARKIGFWPFVSHEGPREWEWDHARAWDESARISPSRGGTPAQLVAAQSGVLEDAGGLADRLVDLAPRPQGKTFGEFFAYRPEWVCLATVPAQSQLPEILDAPSTPNWLGGPAHPVLRYEDHADVLREWHSRYDASICYLGSNSLMVQVGSPPRTVRDAAAVAIEQYAYCPDLDQVIGTLDDVAREQAGARQWFFWWD
jgi:hypothetical protein